MENIILKKNKIRNNLRNRGILPKVGNRRTEEQQLIYKEVIIVIWEIISNNNTFFEYP
jgi:hypothetical protein